MPMEPAPSQALGTIHCGSGTLRLVASSVPSKGIRDGSTLWLSLPTGRVPSRALMIIHCGSGISKTARSYGHWADTRARFTRLRYLKTETGGSLVHTTAHCTSGIFG